MPHVGGARDDRGGAALPVQLGCDVILCHICTTRFPMRRWYNCKCTSEGTAWFQDHDVPVGVCPPFHFHGMRIMVCALWYVHCREICFSHLHGTLAYPYTWTFSGSSFNDCIQRGPWTSDSDSEQDQLLTYNITSCYMQGVWVDCIYTRGLTS